MATGTQIRRMKNPGLLLALVAVLAFLSCTRGSPPITQQLQQTNTPTLGFNPRKDVSPVLDSDALLEEGKLEKQLPGNEFVKTARALHEGALMQQFVEGFEANQES